MGSEEDDLIATLAALEVGDDVAGFERAASLVGELKAHADRAVCGEPCEAPGLLAGEDGCGWSIVLVGMASGWR